MSRIVLIEDDLLLAENTSLILTLNGYECFVANSSKEGILLIEEIIPDLVVCDIMLDSMDGFDVLRIIRQEKGFINLPFIFLSGLADLTDKRKGMNLGADDFLTKPYSSKDLIETIQARIEISSAKKVNAAIETRKNAIDVFYQISTHEYLTPLNGIINFGRLLEEMINQNDLKEANSIVKAIQASGQRMLRVTRKLLWYNQLVNRIDPWGNAHSNAKVNIAELQKNIFYFLKNSTNTQFNISFKGESSFWFGCDRELLEQMLTELLQNVIQHSDPRFEIHSEAFSENNMFVLKITNYYKGSYSMNTALIKPFYQAHYAKDMNGSGLGLYIVKEWATKQRGSLEVNTNNNIFEVILKIPVLQID
ncbi:response regulator [Arcicella aquatica]|uniref:histidine kinase n=1 Tax=Arcicella aquatica TaxID=217141 RepID=A0ABU5QGW3_9BACT|nr:response regulator [Arcicella aquatica]MEA5256282.1 response regulator [Arcicella aquatica]